MKYRGRSIEKNVGRGEGQGGERHRLTEILLRLAGLRNRKVPVFILIMCPMNRRLSFYLLRMFTIVFVVLSEIWECSKSV